MPVSDLLMIIYAVVIIAYLAFIALVVWMLADRVPGTMVRVMITVAVLIGGLPPILMASGQVLA